MSLFCAVKNESVVLLQFFQEIVIRKKFSKHWRPFLDFIDKMQKNKTFIPKIYAFIFFIDT